MRKLTYSFACLVLLASPMLRAQTDLGTVNIGSNGTASVTATIQNPGTLAAISVTTGGHANLDFTATGGSCAIGSHYNAADTCTIDVTFTPTLAGQRYGGFILTNQDGSIAAQGYLRGVGQGPQIVYWPGTTTQLLSNVVAPNGLATDAAGSVYAVEGAYTFTGASAQSGAVLELPGNNSAAAASVVQSPTGISVDGAGNTYLADAQDSESVLMPGGTFLASSPIQNFIGADVFGNRYQTCAAGLCKETLQPDGTYIESTVTTDSNLTVEYIDPQGDIYGTENDGLVHEFISTPGGYVAVEGSTDNRTVISISADNLGNVYGLDSNGNVLRESQLPDGGAVRLYLFNNAMAAYSTNSQVLSASAGQGSLIAADSAGNVFYWENMGTLPAPNLAGHTYPVYGLFEQNFNVPPALTFANTAQLAASDTQTVLISNSGNEPLEISAIAFPADFSEKAPASGECAPGTSLATNASCTLTIQFAPVANLSGASAQLTEQVLVTTNLHNVPGTQQAITVTGIETPSTLPILSFSPASLTFTSTFPGATSAPLTITVTNNGAVNATVVSYKLTGPNAGAFSLDYKTCGYSLPAHSSCTLTYLFKPTTAGPISATLVATDNAVGAPQSVSFSGTGTAPAVLSFTPGGLTFPVTKVGSSSAAQILTISNVSASPMAVASYTFAGANASNFTLVSKTCSSLLVPGSSCTLSIAFRPTATGPASASLVALDSAGGSPQSAPLAGTGK